MTHYKKKYCYFQYIPNTAETSFFRNGKRKAQELHEQEERRNKYFLLAAKNNK